MPIYSPSEMQEQAAQLKGNQVEDALERCNKKIREAMAQGDTKVRIWTGIEYGDSDYIYVDSALEAAGYRVDSEVGLRHGHVVDVEWDE